MANEPKMKIGIGADTGDFEKGSRKVKQGMKDLEKVSSDALGSIGSALGINVGRLQQFSSALQGLGTKLRQTGNEGAAAFGSILQSIGPVATGIAGLGIGAAITGFRALKAEADNFTNTIDGLNLKLSTQSYIETYRQALHDANAGTGKTVGETMAEWQKGWERFKDNVGATFVQWVAGDDTVGLAAAWDKVSVAAKEAEAAAERNEERGDRLATVMRRELDVRREVAAIDTEIAKQRRIVRDRSASTAERTEAEAEARRLTERRTRLQTEISEELYRLQKQMSDEAGDTYEDTLRVTTAYERWQGQLAAAEDSMAQIDRYSNSIKKSTDGIDENIQRIQRIRDAGGAAAVESGAIISTPVTAPVQLMAPQREFDRFKRLAEFELAGISVQIGMELDAEKWNETIQQAADSLKRVMTDGVVSLSESIGTLLGDLATGQSGWSNFANAAISAFGDMAIAIGKIAIEAGLATLGIKAALEKLGPAGSALAIAAGAALVALGSAVKTGMGNIANGNYSSSVGVASSTSSSITGGFEQRDVYVNVQGTLVADGDQLLAVINNTDKKNYFTT